MSEALRSPYAPPTPPAKPDSQFPVAEMLAHLEKHEPKHVLDLLKLLCCLGGTEIPLSLLRRGNSPRPVWDSNGEICHVAETHLKIQSVLVEKNLVYSIEYLDRYKLIFINSEGKLADQSTISVQNGMYKRLRSFPDRVEMELQAMILVCHAFPRDRDLESQFSPLGRSYLYPLRFAVDSGRISQRREAGEGGCRHMNDLVIEACLAASVFPVPSTIFKAMFLGVAEDILEEQPESEPYLLNWALLRRETLNRAGIRDRNMVLADEGVARIFVRPEIVTKALSSLIKSRDSRRSNAQSMKLSLSHAQNLIEKDNYAGALSLLRGIRPLESIHGPSTLETIVLRQCDFTIGKTLRFMGRFEEAAACFRQLLSDVPTKHGSYRSMISHHVETLIEQGDPAQAAVFLEQERTEDISGQNNITISRAEVLLHQKNFAQAIALLSEWTTKQRPPADNNARAYHLRVLTILARASHFDPPEGDLSTALRYWVEADKNLKILEEHGWNKNGFIQMMINYSMGDIYLKTDMPEEANRLIEKANEISRIESTKFWVTGLGTYWFKAIRKSIVSSGGEVSDLASA